MKYFRHAPLAATTAIVLALGIVSVSAATSGNEVSYQRRETVSIVDVSSWWERVREANRLADSSDASRSAWSKEAVEWARSRSETSGGDAAVVWTRAKSLAEQYANVSASQASTVVAEMAALADRAGALAHGEDVDPNLISG